MNGPLERPWMVAIEKVAKALAAERAPHIIAADWTSQLSTEAQKSERAQRFVEQEWEKFIPQARAAVSVMSSATSDENGR